MTSCRLESLSVSPHYSRVRVHETRWRRYGCYSTRPARRRLRRATRERIRRFVCTNYAGVLIIGSDLPTLPPTHVESAIAALVRSTDPVVIGPALDGGYYLIGLRMCHPELFRGIPWSTAAVCGETACIANRSGLAVSFAPSWYDVDSIEDLHRVLERGHGWARGGRTRAWLGARLAGNSVVGGKGGTGK
jgi:2-phospho-L-lactate guanylyltransferase (CobY/MobA/RfbA family)